LRCPDPRSPVILTARNLPAEEARTGSFHKTIGAGGSLSGKSGSLGAEFAIVGSASSSGTKQSERSGGW